MLSGHPADFVFDIAMGMQAFKDNAVPLSRMSEKDFGKGIAAAVAAGLKAGR